MSKKILLVDDAETILMVERMILGKGNYSLVIARDGEEALRKVDAEKPDLILMDVMMPKMNGFDTCKKLRGKESTKSIPIILVTTRGEAENMEKGFAVGCTDYVLKPINASELMAKVKNYLGE